METASSPYITLATKWIQEVRDHANWHNQSNLQGCHSQFNPLQQPKSHDRIHATTTTRSGIQHCNEKVMWRKSEERFTQLSYAQAQQCWNS